ncbi:MAG TPA: hypothetical protein VEP90_20635 [Methylomirabilota bacterium]|nr:hypothetical protein [Methylomirabilota bacterium]
MSYWDHRVLRKNTGDPNEPEAYQIHEVYYNDNGEVRGWTEDPVQPYGETFEELRSECEMFLSATLKSVLDLKELVEESESRQRKEEADFTAKYGYLTYEEQLKAVDEIDEICQHTKDGKHCVFRKGHTYHHELQEPMKMLRQQFDMLYYPTSLLQDVFPEDEEVIPIK